MIDPDKIPEPLFKELIYLFGYDKAEEIANNVNYDFYALQWAVLNEKTIRKFGINAKTLFIIIIIILFILICLFDFFL